MLPKDIPTISSSIAKRQSDYWVETPDFLFDYSRQNMNDETLEDFQTQFENKACPKIKEMFTGHHINFTEDRSVLHYLNRWSPEKLNLLEETAHRFKTELGLDTEPARLLQNAKDIFDVRKKVESFVDRVRSGDHKLTSGLPVTDIVCLGIGGSYLGPKSVYDALKNSPDYQKLAEGRRLHFIANVDPMSVYKVMSNVNYKQTLLIVISKSFGTQETLQNMRLAIRWMLKKYEEAESGKTKEEIVYGHVVAISANADRAVHAGIPRENIFGMFSHTGGRFSVSSAVGTLPLGLVFGNTMVHDFLEGMHSIDLNFFGLDSSLNESIFFLNLGTIFFK